MVCEASDLDSVPDLRETLAASPGAVVCVLGEHVDEAHAGTSLCCEDLSRVRAATTDAEAVRNDTRLRYRDPAEEQRENQEDVVGPVQEEASLEGQETEALVPPAPHQAGGTRPRVRLRLFAERLAVEVDGKEVSGLRTVGRTLLAYLALRPRGATAEEIVQTCFAAMDPHRAASARKNAMTSVRSCLRSALEEPGHHIVEQRNGRYALDADIFSVDLWSFSASYKEAKKASGGQRRDLLREVIDAHAGKLLSGMEDAWLESTRKACVRMVVESLPAVAGEAQGEGEEIELLERACLFDEFNEPIYQRIMETHMSLGRPEIAHQTYRSLKDKLSLIGEKPSPASRAVIESATESV